MNRALIYIILAVLIGLGALIGCKLIYTGTAETGLAHFPKNNKISAEKAVEFAGPYLDESYKLRQSGRSGNYPPNLPTSTYVILKGQAYNVFHTRILVEHYYFYCWFVDNRWEFLWKEIEGR